MSGKKSFEERNKYVYISKLSVWIDEDTINKVKI